MSISYATIDEAGIEAGGSAKGVAVAVVQNNQDDSGLGRVKVSYPWHSAPTESYWARIATPMAGGERGVYFIPEVGDEVLVAFERGDVRFPYVLGSLWNGVDPAPFNNGDGKNDQRAIVTRSGHKLTFDDGEEGKVQIELSDGKRVTIDSQGIELNDEQGNSVVIQSAGGSIAIEAKTELKLKAPQVSIEGGTVKAKADATLELKGTLVTIN